MKSHIDKLKKRGYAEATDIERYKAMSVNELYTLLNSHEAVERTCAIRLLSLSKDKDMAFLHKVLLEGLAVETALYTKIEISETLHSGNETTAGLMYNYLGEIGDNQHRTLPGIEGVSNKKSYPLPRDIIARIFGKMNSALCKIWLDKLNTARDRIKDSELIDGVGFMAFYNPSLVIEENFRFIEDAFEFNKKDELMVWKIATCCSAFPIRKSLDLLDVINIHYADETIQSEVQRSRNIIKTKYVK